MDEALKTFELQNAVESLEQDAEQEKNFYTWSEADADAFLVRCCILPSKVVRRAVFRPVFCGSKRAVRGIAFGYPRG